MPDLTDPVPTDPLAAALARLRPAPAAVEKPAFLFRAGQASRDAVVRRWQAVAAATALALVASVGYGCVRFAELQARAEAAEARAREYAAVIPPAAPPPAPPAEPSHGYPVPDAPAPQAAPSYDPDPTPEELADALRQRNEILTAGLTLLPPAAPPAARDGRRFVPGGVFAVPPHEPRKPPPVFPPDDDNQ